MHPSYTIALESFVTVRIGIHEREEAAKEQKIISSAERKIAPIVVREYYTKGRNTYDNIHMARGSVKVGIIKLVQVMSSGSIRRKEVK